MGTQVEAGPARALRFVGITFALSWALLGLTWAAGLKWGGLVAVAVGVPLMWIPGGVAIALARREQGAGWRDALGLRLRWSWSLVAAPLIPILLALLATGLGFLMPGVSYDPSVDALLSRFAAALTPEQLAAAKQALDTLPIHPFWLSLPQAAVAGVTVNAAAALGEELGWRGYLDHALGSWGFWPRNLGVGVVWGLWHAPIILQGHNYPSHPVAGVGLMVLFCVGLAPILGALRARADSVVAAAFGHGAVNASAGLPLLVTAGGSDLTVGATGAAGLIALLLANGVLAALRATALSPERR